MTAERPGFKTESGDPERGVERSPSRETPVCPAEFGDSERGLSDPVSV